METVKNISCILLGNGNLTLECAQHLKQQGHHIEAVISSLPELSNWSVEQNITCYRSEAEFTAEQPGQVDYVFNIINHQALSDEIIALARHYCINFYDAPLPELIGLGAPYKAVLDARQKYSVCWHTINPGFQAGAVLHSLAFEMDATETAFSLSLKCLQAGKDSFASLITGLLADSLTPVELNIAEPLLQQHRLDNAGIINFEQSAEALQQLFRAIDFGGETNLVGCPKLRLGQELYLVSGLDVTESPSTRPAGTLMAADQQSITVSTHSNDVKLKGLTNLTGKQVDSAAVATVGSQVESLTGSELAFIKRLDSEFAEQEEFCLQQLGKLEPIKLSGFGLKPAASDAPINEFNLVLNSAVQSLSAQLQLSAKPSEVVAALYACFLQRLADTQAVHLACIYSGENPFGLYAEQLPLLLDIDSSKSLNDLLPEILLQIASCNQQGSYLKDLLVRDKTLSDSAIPLAIELCQQLSDSSKSSQASLLMRIAEDAQTVQWQFNTAALSQPNMDKISRYFDCFIEQALNNLSMPLAQLHLIAETERDTLLGRWNETAKALPEGCVFQQIEQQASNKPEIPALVYQDQQINYGELNTRANQLAYVMLDLGVKPGDLVGVFIERSIEMMVSLLAIQKAGAAYVPLDPAYPRERIAYMIEDSQTRLILTQSKLISQLPNQQANMLAVDTELSKNVAAQVNPDIGVTTNSLAYVIYTSGSTGKPKGVMVEHGNLLNFVVAMDDTLEYQGEPGVWLAVTSISFDISILELFWSLSRGFKVIIQEEEARTIALNNPGISTVAKPLDVGLFYFSSDAGPDASGDRYKLLMEGARYADQHGFSTVWTPERHFHLFGGLYPNPSVTSAAVAAVTERVAIRAGSIVLPLHNPIRVAEEWSVVDNLSNGRVGFSFASGWHANDFSLMPENFPRRKELMMEQIETVRKLWRGESIELSNGEGKPFTAKIYPPSIQKEPQIWITTSSSLETFRMAGEAGHNVLTNLLGQTVDELAEKIAAYRSGRQTAGLPLDGGNVSLMVHTFVGKDVDEVREIVREPFSNYLKTSFDLVKVAPWAFPAFKQPSKAAAQDASFDADSLTSEDMDALIAHAFERYFETAGIFGTPESVMPLVDQLKSAGVDEVACLIDFGVEDQLVLDNLEHLNRFRELANPKTVDADTSKDFSLAAQIKRHGVTHFQCTPSMARILASDNETFACLQTLDKFLLGGEALPLDLAQTIQKGLKGDLINVYGPTETTIWSTSSKLPKQLNELNIGRPIANTRIYILDSHFQPTPIGVPGELMIGGKGVVRGYLNRPELTAEKFIDNPLGVADDPRIYRTGDLARYKENGEIDFLGRIDQQVKLRGYRIELGEIESLINANTQIKESVVTVLETEQQTEELVAYLVAEKAGANDASHWQTIWDQAYQGNTQELATQASVNTQHDPCFDISGWLDSYTGEQHKDEHMREWVETTVERIQALKPRRILEIGCGTGLLLYRLAPSCQAYTGVDFSAEALAKIGAQLDGLGLNQVELLQSAADTLSLDNAAEYDVIVINSVAQYFPGGEYLLTVLNKLQTYLSADGAIFLGDIRAEQLKESFHLSLEMAKAPANLTLNELKQRVKEHSENESELLIAPDFFLNLPQKMQSISHVDLQLKPGVYRTEMSAYRYDVVLQFGTQYQLLKDDDFSLAVLPQKESELEQLLTAQRSNLVFRDVPNARLQADILAQSCLETEPGLTLVSDLVAFVEQKQTEAAYLPELFYRHAGDASVTVHFAQSGKHDAFDVYIAYPQGNQRLQLTPHDGDKDLLKYCYEPKLQRSDFELVSQLKEKLRSALPEFMVPSEYVVLPALPLTPNGKIDRKALPKPEKRQRQQQQSFVAPESDIEVAIAEVLAEMLNLEKIGTQDNFFSLGANSLLIAQANNRLGQRLQRNVSLVAMYRYPTIAKLAEHLSGKSDNKQSASAGVERAQKRKAAAAKRRRARPQR